MKNLARFLCVFMLVNLYHFDAKSADLSMDVISDGNYSIGQDTTIMPNILLEAHDTHIANSIKIINFGTISGGITVNANRVLELQNAGTFNATVNLESGASIVQVITNSNEITDIGLGSGFSVSVRDVDGLNLDGVMAVASNADTVEFHNVKLNVGNMSGFVAPENIVLSGDVILSFDNVSGAPLLLFSNATGNGVVYVDSGALDALHVFETYKVDQDVFVRLVRSTDYARILNDDMGRFLNDLRASGRDDKLFSKLDYVKTMGELNGVLSHSVRTNPIKLMRPISLINSYKMLEIMHIDNGVVLGAEPIMIYSSDVFMYGIQPNVTFNMSDDLHMEISGYVMNMDYSDDINEYGGNAFGVGIGIQYDINNDDFVRLHFGGGKSCFDVGPVFADNAVITNPDGMSMYGIGEYGREFRLNGGYKVSPFVGIGTEYITVANADNTEIYGVGGTDIGYEYVFDGLRYNYSARALIRTDGTFGGGINLSAWSVFDAAGADMYIGTIYNDDFGMSLKISLNGRFRF